MKHDGGWKRRSSSYLFESGWFNLRQDQVELPGGDRITYTLVEHPGYAMVVPVLPDGRVVMERLFRYTVQETVLECPSGGLDGDAPEVAARRELLEETGYAAGSLRSLGSFFGSNGISDELFHLFLAAELEDTGRTRREATEQMEIVLLPLERAPFSSPVRSGQGWPERAGPDPGPSPTGGDGLAEPAHFTHTVFAFTNSRIPSADSSRP